MFLASLSVACSPRLHCGQPFNSTGPPYKTSLCGLFAAAPFKAGSIATSPSHGRTPGARGCSRRATAGSIAAASSAAKDCRLGQMLPPFDGGLHCGTSFSWMLPRMFRCSRLTTAGSIAAAKIPAESCNQRHVLPPSDGGLHCGCSVIYRPTDNGGRGAPALSGGLHCGLVPWLMIIVSASCSRRPTAGSIAARRTATPPA
jgi:hypothetical protein